jgi:hypothetical protein
MVEIAHVALILANPGVVQRADLEPAPATDIDQLQRWIT